MVVSGLLQAPTALPPGKNYRRVQLKCNGTRWRTGGEVKGKLANGVGSQYPSHYLGTWCIQHYYSMFSVYRLTSAWCGWLDMEPVWFLWNTEKPGSKICQSNLTLVLIVSLCLIFIYGKYFLLSDKDKGTVHHRKGHKSQEGGVRGVALFFL